METTIETAAGPARVTIDQPAGEPACLLVLTHGSGGTPDTADVLAVAGAGLALGAVTALVTQPYVVRGARAPGSADKQDAAWTQIVAALKGRYPGLPVIQGGRSNGARVTCRTAHAVGARGVIALAFPLHPPGHPERTRAAELPCGAHAHPGAQWRTRPLRDPRRGRGCQGDRASRADACPFERPRRDWRGRWRVDSRAAWLASHAG